MSPLLGQTALVTLVSAWWVALLVWRSVPLPSSRLWLALTMFALSATLFLPPVAEFAARLEGSASTCNEFENVWGVITSGAIIAALTGQASERRRYAVVGVTVVAVGAIVILARASHPAPSGCVNTLHLPPTDTYWWILLTFHLASDVFAAYCCLTDARALSRERFAMLGLLGLSAGFIASLTFWTLMAVNLVTGDSRFGDFAALSVFPVTVVAMSGASVVIALQRLAFVLKKRSEVGEAWREFVTQFRATYPDRQTPTRHQELGRWWAHPDHAIHRMRIQIADLRVARVGVQRRSETH